VSGARTGAPVDWRLLCTASAVFFLVGAALIHAVWMAIHLQESMIEGAAFLAMAVAQSAVAFGLLIAPGRRIYLFAIALSLAIVGLWAVSRTVGMPIGPSAGGPEAIGMPDVMATLFEMLTVFAIVPLVRGGEVAGRRRRRTHEGVARTYAVVSGLGLYTIILTALAVVPAATTHADDPAATATHDHTSPPTSRSPPTAAVELIAQQLSFDASQLSLLAGQQVEVRLRNLDDADHNFSVYRDAGFGDSVFNGDVATAGGTQTYTFPSPAPGRYWFRCDLHPAMSGEVTFS
jgi:plastocyanin